MKTLPTTPNTIPLSTHSTPPTAITGGTEGWYGNGTTGNTILDADCLNSQAQDFRQVLVAGGQNADSGNLLAALQHIAGSFNQAGAYLPLAGGALTGALSSNSNIVIDGNAGTPVVTLDTGGNMTIAGAASAQTLYSTGSNTSPTSVPNVSNFVVSGNGGAGYFRLPGGLTIQFQAVSITNSGVNENNTTVFQLPTPFANQNLSSICGWLGKFPPPNVVLACSPNTLSTVQVTSYGQVNSNGGLGVVVWSIGY